MRDGAWVAVDFDGTLATDDGPWPAIGQPVLLIIDLVKRILRTGIGVRIFTARCFDERGVPDLDEIEKVAAWCVQHLGTTLPITCMKDKNMILLIDDRAVACEKNTGWLRTYRTDLLAGFAGSEYDPARRENA